jgi:hypothetical protein
MCPLMQSLALSDCHNIVDFDVHRAVEIFPNWRYLEMSENNNSHDIHCSVMSDNSDDEESNILY